MKAIVYTKYGTHDVLELRKVNTPISKDNEVLIRVLAVAINDWDWQLLQGIPIANRLENGLLKPKKQILGFDIAGRIESVGKNVKRFKSGDEVYGDLSGTWGGFAEFVCARENQLAMKPSSMSFEQAASISHTANLTIQGLIDKNNLKQGQKILINGAGGGVGTFGIQIAKLYGAEVTGVDSTVKLDLLRSIGFDHVIDYTQEDFTKNGQCYDLILDTKTNRSVFDYTRSLNPNGTYVTVGGNSLQIIQILLLRPLIFLFTKKNMRLVILKPNKDLAYINKLFEAGKVKPVIDGHYSLEEVPKAMRYFGEANHKGKVVITIKHN